jgi:hypothetical protein
MSNHYHRALETPEANLVQGMAWLQGTFANRFNRFHGERGHVFQSRYQSILIRNYENVCVFWRGKGGAPRRELTNYLVSVSTPRRVLVRQRRTSPSTNG